MRTVDCFVCGTEMHWETHGLDTDMCSRACSDAARVFEAEQWPVTFGLAVRRFVRACEVARLREDVCMGDSELFRTALDRLAQLAKEVK